MEMEIAGYAKDQKNDKLAADGITPLKTQIY
jgi:hypothetical protein